MMVHVPKSPAVSDSEQVAWTAQHILMRLDAYWQEFASVTARARQRFEGRDWRGAQRDAAERLRLLKRTVWRTIVAVRAHHGGARPHRAQWQRIKAAFEQATLERYDREVAHTFFNSVTRRLFGVVGIDGRLEFLAPTAQEPNEDDVRQVYRTYRIGRVTGLLITRLLESYAFHCGYESLERDARMVAERVRLGIQRAFGGRGVDSIEMLHPVFFRNKGAYLIGRVRSGDGFMPLVIALVHGHTGIVVDAVLTETDVVSIVFSFTRSYFHVSHARYREVIAFLRSILSHKRVAELYISIGLFRHGKREFYHDLQRHLARSTDQFETAPGRRGMVMTVFTLPSYDVVFKVIRDRFEPPKRGNRELVREKYRYVFEHDRAGRLVDAQEFENLEIARDRFSQAALAELLVRAPSSVHVEGDRVVVKHLYVERRVVPLDVFVEQADMRSVIRAVVDYGYCIKELAAANIFPGDIFLKNFGVTRHGRVVFYDYDELCAVTDCNFRRIPPSRSDAEELDAEPWFPIADNDVFPEEFGTFLGLGGKARAAFLRVHADLLDPDFWQTMQARHLAGEVMDVFAYPRHERLARYH